MTKNPGITVFALSILPILVLLLWQRGEFPVLLFACLMQWLQAAVGIFYQNFHGRTLDDAFGGAELAEATWLSLIGVAVLALGIRLALVGLQSIQWEAVEKEARSLSPNRIFFIFLLFLIVTTLIRKFAFRVPGLAQPLFAATSLEWVPVILLAEAVLTQRQSYGLLLLIITIEFMSGLLGYFSSFKSVFFILAVVLLGSSGRPGKGRWVALAVIFFFVLLASCAWTAIKADYRLFLNQGTGQQLAAEPIGTRVLKLMELVGDLDADKLEDGFEDSMLRLSYVTLFAHCISHVPDVEPHARGGLWWGAVQHTFMPRLFFPNKPVVDDSMRAQKYTGLNLSGREEGTSIGIGYIAESYVDFGRYGMFVPIFLLGVFYGLIYRILVFRQTNRLLGMACAIAILVFGAYTIETSNTKLVGGNTMSVLVLGLFYWRLGPAFMRFFIQPLIRPAKKPSVPARRFSKSQPRSSPRPIDS